MKHHFIGNWILNIMMLVAVSLSAATVFGQEPTPDATKTTQPISRADTTPERTEVSAETVAESEPRKNEVVSLGLADTSAEATANRFQPTRFSRAPITMAPGTAAPKQSATPSELQF